MSLWRSNRTTTACPECERIEDNIKKNYIEMHELLSELYVPGNTSSVNLAIGRLLDKIKEAS